MEIEAHILGLKEKYRGDELESQLIDFGIDFKVTYGLTVDNPKFALQTSKSIILENLFFENRLTLGEKACYIGHLRMFENAKNGNAQTVLFFEDDAFISSRTEFESLLKWIGTYKLPKGIFLLYSNKRHRLTMKYCTSQVPKFFRNLCMPTGTVAYMMNRETLIEILANLASSKIDYFRSDYPVFKNIEISYFVSNVDYVTESGAESIIGDRKPVQNRIMSSIYQRFKTLSFLRWLGVSKHVSVISYLRYYHLRTLSEWVHRLRIFVHYDRNG